MEGVVEAAMRVVVVERERERRISRLYGEDPLACQEFVEEVRRAWSSISASDSQRRLDLILDNVGPAIKDELRSQPAEVASDPEKVLGIITSVFGERRAPAQLLQQLFGHQQLIPETVRAYANRCQKAYQTLVRRQEALGETPYPDRLLRDHFIGSLKDRTLCRFLRHSLTQSPQQSFLQIRETAIGWADDLPGEEAADVAPVTASVPESPRDSTEKILAAILEKLDALASRPQRESVKRSSACYGCGAQGHFKKDCPKVKRSRRSEN